MKLKILFCIIGGLTWRKKKFLNEILRFEYRQKSLRLNTVFSPNAGKYGPEKTPYLDNFYGVACTRTKEKGVVLKWWSSLTGHYIHKFGCFYLNIGSILPSSSDISFYINLINGGTLLSISTSYVNNPSLQEITKAFIP